MNSVPNPYESTAVTKDSRFETPEKIWRIRFAVSMWVCGIVGIQCLPYYPWVPEYWAAQGVPITVGSHLAWLGSFCCSAASVTTALCLFRLPRIGDKLGAVFCILLVGWWPGMLAISWWYYFATH